jgi:hypothetical protein
MDIAPQGDNSIVVHRTTINLLIRANPRPSAVKKFFFVFSLYPSKSAVNSFLPFTDKFCQWVVRLCPNKSLIPHSSSQLPFSLFKKNLR